MMNNGQFPELFGSQWPPDHHGGHSSATTMLHPSMQQSTMVKREPHTDVMHSQMGMGMQDIASVADSTSPPPGSGDGMFSTSMNAMFMDKKGANSIRGRYNFFFSIDLSKGCHTNMTIESFFFNFF